MSISEWAELVAVAASFLALLLAGRKAVIDAEDRRSRIA